MGDERVSDVRLRHLAQHWPSEMRVVCHELIAAREELLALRAREERLRAVVETWREHTRRLVRAWESGDLHPYTNGACPAEKLTYVPHAEGCPLGDAMRALDSDAPPREAFDLRAHLQRQREWSERTFGPGSRAAGVIDHIRKELREIEADPTDLEEWIDVVILALDGAWRSGASPDEIVAQLVAKQAKNEVREWPDWRTQPTDRAIEHVRAERPERCPRCDSPAPHLHPAMQHEGEVQPCSDAWHAPPREAGGAERTWLDRQLDDPEVRRAYDEERARLTGDPELAAAVARLDAVVSERAGRRDDGVAAELWRDMGANGGWSAKLDTGDWCSAADSLRDVLIALAADVGEEASGG